MSDDKNNDWEMPKPVFRTSTGSLPRSLEETMSQSFQPNTGTIELDEHDDILSIMDTPYRPDAPKFAENHDSEKTLEIDRDIILEIPTVPETEPAAKPIVVTAKNPADNDSKSNLFVFILIGLIVTAIIAGLLYFSQPTSTP